MYNDVHHRFDVLILICSDLEAKRSRVNDGFLRPGWKRMEKSERQATVAGSVPTSRLEYDRSTGTSDPDETRQARLDRHREPSIVVAK